MTREAHNLFRLQAEIIDLKVDKSVSIAIDRVINKIDELENKMDTRFNALENRVTAIETKLSNRLTAVETKLGMVNERNNFIRSRFYDYSFKAGWLILGVVLSWLILHFHTL